MQSIWQTLTIFHVATIVLRRLILKEKPARSAIEPLRQESPFSLTSGNPTGDSGVCAYYLSEENAPVRH